MSYRDVCRGIHKVRQSYDSGFRTVNYNISIKIHKSELIDELIRHFGTFLVVVFSAVMIRVNVD